MQRTATAAAGGFGVELVLMVGLDVCLVYIAISMREKASWVIWVLGLHGTHLSTFIHFLIAVFLFERKWDEMGRNEMR